MKKNGAATGSRGHGARETALRILIEMERNAAYSDVAIRRHTRNAAARGAAVNIVDDTAEDTFTDTVAYTFTGAVTETRDAREQALVRELVYGVAKWKLTLDHIIFTYSKIKKEKIATEILTILRIAVYQIAFLSRIPHYAACDECVRLAKKYGNEGSVKYVNAMLRKIAAENIAMRDRFAGTDEIISSGAGGDGEEKAGVLGAAEPSGIAEADTAKTATTGADATNTATTSSGAAGEGAAEAGGEMPGPLMALAAADGVWVACAGKEPAVRLAKHLSVRYSYPYWLCEKWSGRYGREFASALMDAGNQRPALGIRVNATKISAENLMDRLNSRGFGAVPGRYAKNSLTLQNPSDFSNSEEFRRGLFSVQDESSMLCVEALDPRESDAVLDLCAAPGGKSAYIAEITNDKARVLAADIRAHRISLMERNAARLGLTSIKAVIMDASKFDARLRGAMDRVLLDAPCSGFGVIRKKPEIKWNRTREDIGAIARAQSAMLAAAAGYVKPGGALVYSVCTFEPEECEDVVNAFLREAHGFFCEDLSGRLPAALWDDVPRGGGAGLYIYPHIHRIDGFYIALLRRNANG